MDAKILQPIWQTKCFRSFQKRDIKSTMDGKLFESFYDDELLLNNLIDQTILVKAVELEQKACQYKRSHDYVQYCRTICELLDVKVAMNEERTSIEKLQFDLIMSLCCLACECIDEDDFEQAEHLLLIGQTLTDKNATKFFGRRKSRLCVYNILANLYHLTGELEKCVAICNKAATLERLVSNPETPGVSYINLAYSLYESSDFESGISAIKTAIKIFDSLVDNATFLKFSSQKSINFYSECLMISHYNGACISFEIDPTNVSIPIMFLADAINTGVYKLGNDNETVARMKQEYKNIANLNYLPTMPFPRVLVSEMSNANQKKSIKRSNITSIRETPQQLEKQSDRSEDDTFASTINTLNTPSDSLKKTSLKKQRKIKQFDSTPVKFDDSSDTTKSKTDNSTNKAKISNTRRVNYDHINRLAKVNRVNREEEISSPKPSVEKNRKPRIRPTSVNEDSQAQLLNNGSKIYVNKEARKIQKRSGESRSKNSSSQNFPIRRKSIYKGSGKVIKEQKEQKKSVSLISEKETVDVNVSAGWDKEKRLFDNIRMDSVQENKQQKEKKEQNKQEEIQEKKKREDIRKQKILEQKQREELTARVKREEEAKKLQIEMEKNLERKKQTEILLEKERQEKIERQERIKREQEELERLRKLEAEKQAEIEKLRKEKAEKEEFERCRLEAEKQAEIEKQKREKEEELERQYRLETERQAEIEKLKKEKAEKEEFERCRLEAEKQAEIEKLRKEKAEKEEFERCRLEAEKQAEIEKQKREKEEELERQQILEAERQAKIEKLRREKAEKEEFEKRRLEAEKHAEMEKQKREKEEEEKELERCRLEAERQAEVEKLRRIKEAKEAKETINDDIAINASETFVKSVITNVVDKFTDSDIDNSKDKSGEIENTDKNKKNEEESFEDFENDDFEEEFEEEFDNGINHTKSDSSFDDLRNDNEDSIFEKEQDFVDNEKDTKYETEDEFEDESFDDDFETSPKIEKEVNDNDIGDDHFEEEFEGEFDENFDENIKPLPTHEKSKSHSDFDSHSNTQSDFDDEFDDEFNDTGKSTNHLSMSRQQSLVNLTQKNEIESSDTSSTSSKSSNKSVDEFEDEFDDFQDNQDDELFEAASNMYNDFEDDFEN
eukprot:TRINITY_DN2793_c1_g1_i1.p1 TRINITY_DN2793_c1_g1~~TRINITY_DN2793_c1_g1_i1.p1  ORF type:complete len:1138 (+),score=442.74 TRINITY_DN2793_c1_g1_i1:35-3415(+)